MPKDKNFDLYCSVAEHMFDNMESPIEKAFCGAFLLELLDINNIAREIECEEDAFFVEPRKINICAQYVVDDKYRVDFCVTVNPFSDIDIYDHLRKREKNQRVPFIFDVCKPFKIFVELDGHEFHEKTKEQVDYRNERDAYLQNFGFVYHISGRQITSDCKKTVQGFFDFIQEVGNKVFMERRKIWRSVLQTQKNF